MPDGSTRRLKKSTSALANLEIPEEIRRRITGHESSEIHAKYTHHEAATMAAAVRKLPSL